MTDTAKKPIDDPKEELTEAELDQVAGGVAGVLEVVPTKHTLHEKGAQPENQHVGV
jgi:hypothetical protein